MSSTTNAPILGIDLGTSTCLAGVVHEGRVRLNFVNQRVNNAIRYTSDMTQWGTPDEWSAPLAAGKGSFETGLPFEQRGEAARQVERRCDAKVVSNGRAAFTLELAVEPGIGVQGWPHSAQQCGHG